MPVTRLYLVRHGQVEGYEDKRYNGQSDVSLTDLGMEQSASIDDCLRSTPMNAVYSSDLERSRHCAALMADTHNLDVVVRESLRELNVGEWEGKTWAELQEAYPDDWQARLQDPVNFRVPGGESLLDVAQRIRPVIKQILHAHRGETVALIAHGGVNRIILLDAIGASLSSAFSIEQDFGCINIIDYLDDGHSVVRLINSLAHLEDVTGLTAPVANG